MRGKYVLIAVAVIVGIWIVLALGARLISGTAEAAILTPANTPSESFATSFTTDVDPADALYKAHGFGCGTGSVTVTRHDVVGNDLFKAKWSQHWCFNGTYVANVKPLHVKGWTTGWGDDLGWSYRGIVAGDRKGHYLNHHHSHVSWAKARFVECTPLPTGCAVSNVQDYPGRFRVYANGGIIFDWKP